MKADGRTVIYTTHYLEEAEQLCDRMVIMDQGRSIAQGTVGQLQKSISTQERVEVGFLTEYPGMKSRLSELPHVVKVTNKNDCYLIHFEKQENYLSNLMMLIGSNDLSYTELKSWRSRLDDIFLEHTGKGVRD